MKKNSLLLMLLVVLSICLCGCTKEVEGKEADIAAETSNGISLTVVDDTGTPVPNVDIDILKNKDVIDTLVTNKDGKVYMYLDSGEYFYIMKSVPDGFMLDNTQYSLVVDKGIEYIETVLNRKQSSSLSLVTMDQNGKSVSNVSIDILKGEEIIETLVTDENGEISVYLESGMYNCKIKSVPMGYLSYGDITPIEVDQGKTVLQLVVNTEMTGGISIKVFDSEANPIENVEFDIFRDEEVITTLTTNSYGQSDKGLPAGKYYYVMKSVPDGFTLDDTPYSFVINSMELVNEEIYIE